MHGTRSRVSPLARTFCLWLLGLIFLTPFRIIRWLFSQRRTVVEDELEYNDEDDCIPDDPDPLATCPEFMQIIDINEDTVIGIEDIVWCPDETALLRVLTEKDVSKSFKKKVYQFKKDRYIKIGTDKVYLT